MNTLTHQASAMPITAAVRELLHSPQLPRYTQQFVSILEAERERRAQFYEDVSDDQKAEFINGEVIVHSPARLRHTTAVRNIVTLLDVYVSKHTLGYVGQEKVLIALTRNDYEPDVVYFGLEKAQRLTPDQTKFPAPDFIVEVLSPSTESNDRGIKLLDYAAHGVSEYWIVDADADVVEQYVLVDTAYELRMKSQTGVLRSVAVSGFAIPVRAIFDENEKLASVRAILDGSKV